MYVVRLPRPSNIVLKSYVLRWRTAELWRLARPAKFIRCRNVRNVYCSDERWKERMRRRENLLLPATGVTFMWMSSTFDHTEWLSSLVVVRSPNVSDTRNPHSWWIFLISKITSNWKKRMNNPRVGEKRSNKRTANTHMQVNVWIRLSYSEWRNEETLKRLQRCICRNYTVCSHIARIAYVHILSRRKYVVVVSMDKVESVNVFVRVVTRVFIHFNQRTRRWREREREGDVQRDGTFIIEKSWQRNLLHSIAFVLFRLKCFWEFFFFSIFSLFILFISSLRTFSSFRSHQSRTTYDFGCGFFGFSRSRTTHSHIRYVCICVCLCDDVWMFVSFRFQFNYFVAATTTTTQTKISFSAILAVLKLKYPSMMKYARPIRIHFMWGKFLKSRRATDNQDFALNQSKLLSGFM